MQLIYVAYFCFLFVLHARDMAASNYVRVHTEIDYAHVVTQVCACMYSALKYRMTGCLQESREQLQRDGCKPRTSTGHPVSRPGSTRDLIGTASA